MDKRLELIFKRRSVRGYKKGGEVSAEDVGAMLEAGMSAPSVCAKDPWRFIVARNPATLKEIAGLLPNGGMLADASVGIVVCGDIEAAHANELSYLLQDCSAAIQNILLAASAIGLGACWLGVHPRQDRVDGLRKLFKLPDGIIPVSVISVGQPAEAKDARTRYKDEYVHRESW